MQKIKKIILTVIAVFFFSLIIISPVLAESEETDNAAKAVTVYPSILELSGNSGETIKSSFTYANNTKNDQKIAFSINPYVLSEGKSGSPIFNDVSGNPVSSPAQAWIKINNPSDQVVKSGGQVTVDFSITIPQDADLDTYYNAIFVESSPDINIEKTTGNIINYRMGVLTILEVKKPLDFSQYIKIIKNPKLIYYIIALAALIILFIVLVLNLKRRAYRKQKK